MDPAGFPAHLSVNSSLILTHPRGYDSRSTLHGAVAQLGERMNGIHEVEGSIPSGSTSYVIMHEKDRALFVYGHFFLSFSPSGVSAALPCHIMRKSVSLRPEKTGHVVL